MEKRMGSFLVGGCCLDGSGNGGIKWGGLLFKQFAGRSGVKRFVDAAEPLSQHLEALHES